jgi:hypothetical protein
MGVLVLVQNVELERDGSASRELPSDRHHGRTCEQVEDGVVIDLEDVVMAHQARLRQRVSNSGGSAPGRETYPSSRS